jgi:hypothetical protein
MSDELLGIVNVPMAVWVDEDGVIVRPAEHAVIERSEWADIEIQDDWPDAVRDMLALEHLPAEMDYSEIFALQMPSSRFVLNCSEDAIFDITEQRRADRILTEVFDKAGAADQYRCEFYPGGHKFDVPMQEDAFSWFEDRL